MFALVLVLRALIVLDITSPMLQAAKPQLARAVLAATPDGFATDVVGAEAARLLARGCWRTAGTRRCGPRCGGTRRCCRRYRRCSAPSWACGGAFRACRRRKSWS